MSRFLESIFVVPFIFVLMLLVVLGLTWYDFYTTENQEIDTYRHIYYKVKECPRLEAHVHAAMFIDHKITNKELRELDKKYYEFMYKYPLMDLVK